MGAARSELPAFDSWRNAARPWLAAGLKADQLSWSEERGIVTVRSNDAASDSAQPARADLRLPRTLMSLLQNIACYRTDSRWEFMYRLAWRVVYENPQLLDDPADPDVANATAMDKAIRRDLHKMHAFVRFREVTEDDSTSFYAWFEPEHEILRPGAQFFVKRFPNMLWTIATPDGAAVWDMQTLRFVEPGSASDRPPHDAHEDLWRTYYRSICNVARINPSAMQREMPKKYWHNLPEAVEIAPLMREGTAKFAAGHVENDHQRFAGAKRALRPLVQAQAAEGGLQQCRACDLWKHATQAVAGEGPDSARLMLVGEQPGDEEDLRGKPFVGPAGRLLNDILDEAGIPRDELYVTNAVKHFKWEPRGKRRLHKKPNVGEIRACNIWLQQEIELVKPVVIVALGASALNALSGVAHTIEAARAADVVHPSGATLIVSYHPSAILRAEGERGETLRSALIGDLRRAAGLLTPAR